MPKTKTELKRLVASLAGDNPFPTFTTPELNKIAAYLEHLRQSLRLSQASFNSIFNTDIYPLALVTLNEKRIVAINGALLNLIGYTKDEILGRILSELEIWPNPSQCTRVMQLLEERQLLNEEIVFYHRSHQKITELISAEQVNINDTAYFLISLKDITSQKRIIAKLHNSWSNLAEILNCISNVFFALDSNWTFTYVSFQEPFFLTRKREDLMGKVIWEVFPDLTETIYHEELQKALSQRRPVHFQAPSILGDQWYQMDVYPIKNGIAVFGRNITSQKRMVESLQRSNQQIINIMDSIPEAFFFLDTSWRFIYLNQQAEQIFKQPREELIGKRIWEQIPKLADSQIATQFHKGFSENTPIYYEGQFPLSDDFFEFHIYPTMDGITVYMHNITDRKLKEEAQAKTEERYSNILNNIGDPILVLDHNWRITYLNREMERYLKVPAVKIKGKFMWDIQPDFTISSLYQRLNQVLATQQSTRFEEYFPLFNCWMDCNIFYFSSGLVICFRDITARKQSEAELTRSHLRIATILESITDAFYTLDTEWRFTNLNKIAAAIWQKDKEQLIGKKLWNELPQLAGTELERQLHRAVQEQTVVHFEAFIPGINTWLEIHAYPDENGLTVYSRDISTRKKLESSSATERELLLITLRSIGDGVIAADRDGQIILLNKTAEELTGWSYDEAVGLHLNKVFYVINDQTSEPYDNIVPLTIETGETIELPNAVLVNRNYKEFMISNSCAPIRSSDGKVLGVVMVFRDVTEKLKTEAELIKAQKIESLGVLAGGIAHDFNNFLAAIMANIQLAIFRLEKGKDVRKSLNEAIEVTKRASELTKQLLTFAKGGAPIKKAVSIASLLEETTVFHLSGSKVKPIFCIPDDLWHVEVDTGQFSQVISNLVLNAKEAMPQGGTIAIYAENVLIPPGERFKPGRYIKIAVKDYGTGIPDYYLGRIFDPFFTTKQSGSGLGLATAYSIIQKHGGYIDLTTKVGSGTTFFIYLPATNHTAEVATSEEIRPLPGEGKVLVMDDEAMIRNALREMLQLLGYQVTTVPDGREAVQLYQEALDSGKPFKAVIMDLTIPGGMGGLEAISLLRQIDPEVKAIVSSGYANDPVMADYHKYGFSGVIRKPYKIEEFSQVLNRVIGNCRQQRNNN
ncbi:MAG TPA: PAS domain-containing protein [Bacillota bacterium]